MIYVLPLSSYSGVHKRVFRLPRPPAVIEFYASRTEGSGPHIMPITAPVETFAASNGKNKIVIPYPSR